MTEEKNLMEKGSCRKCNKIKYGDTKMDPLADPESILYQQYSVLNEDSAPKAEEQGETIDPEEAENIKNAYKCLAFDDYIKRKQTGFNEFIESFDEHIEHYKQKWN